MPHFSSFAESADLAYFEQGKSEPVVFVHGGISDLRSWEYQLQVFSKNYRAISYSLRYHYPNPWQANTTNYSIPVHAKDLASLIEVLGASPANIVGTSYGGRIALHLARDRPELVRTLVLAEPSLAPFLAAIPEGLPVVADMMKNYFEPAEKAIQSGNLVEAVRLFTNGVAGEGSFEKIPQEVRRRYMDNIRVQAIPTSPAPFSKEDAKGIPIPVLLLTGELSRGLFVLVADELTKYIPNIERARISGSSHLLTVSNPDGFIEAVLAFLAKQ